MNLRMVPGFCHGNESFLGSPFGPLRWALRRFARRVVFGLAPLLRWEVGFLGLAGCCAGPCWAPHNGWAAGELSAPSGALPSLG